MSATTHRAPAPAPAKSLGGSGRSKSMTWVAVNAEDDCVREARDRARTLSRAIPASRLDTLLRFLSDPGMLQGAPVGGAAGEGEEARGVELDDDRTCSPSNEWALSAEKLMKGVGGLGGDCFAALLAQGVYESTHTHEPELSFDEMIADYANTRTPTLCL